MNTSQESPPRAGGVLVALDADAFLRWCAHERLQFDAQQVRAAFEHLGDVATAYAFANERTLPYAEVHDLRSANFTLVNCPARFDGSRWTDASVRAILESYIRRALTSPTITTVALAARPGSYQAMASLVKEVRAANRRCVVLALGDESLDVAGAEVVRCALAPISASLTATNGWSPGLAIKTVEQLPLLGEEARRSSLRRLVAATPDVALSLVRIAKECQPTQRYHLDELIAFVHERLPQGVPADDAYRFTEALIVCGLFQRGSHVRRKSGVSRACFLQQKAHPFWSLLAAQSAKRIRRGIAEMDLGGPAIEAPVAPDESLGTVVQLPERSAALIVDAERYDAWCGGHRVLPNPAALRSIAESLAEKRITSAYAFGHPGALTPGLRFALERGGFVTRSCPLATREDHITTTILSQLPSIAAAHAGSVLVATSACLPTLRGISMGPRTDIDHAKVRVLVLNDELPEEPGGIACNPLRPDALREAAAGQARGWSARERLVLATERAAHLPWKRREETFRIGYESAPDVARALEACFAWPATYNYAYSLSHLTHIVAKQLFCCGIQDAQREDVADFIAVLVECGFFRRLNLQRAGRDQVLLAVNHGNPFTRFFGAPDPLALRQRAVPDSGLED